MSYILPQLQVFQEFRQLPQNVVQNLNAFVFGPQYQLFRYSEEAEKILIGLGAYDPAAATDYAYPNKPAGSIVDQDYAKLFGDDVVLEYLAIPAAAANPVNVVSASEPNKIRSAPRVAAAQKGASQVAAITSGGFYTGLVGLPEAYHVYPAADFTIDSGAGVMNYISTEGLTGSFDVPATATGVVLQAAHGITAKITAGAAVKAPVTIRFANTAGTAYFDLGPSIKAMADAQIAGDALYKVSIASITGSAAAAYTSTPGTPTVNLLALTYNDDTTTLAELHTEIVAALQGASVDQLFELSAVTGSGTVHNGLLSATALLETVFKIPVHPNAYVFKTANGYSRYATLNKDVEVGDKVHYSGTDGISVFEGDTTVVALEADMSLPIVGALGFGADNQVTQAATVLYSPGANIVGRPTSNARAFDAVGTVALTLDDSVGHDYPGAFTDMLAGIKSDTYTVKITGSGLKGVARATVSNSSGTYRRTGVPVENAGTDGMVYLGNNIAINFVKGVGDADAIFQAGDEYYVTVDMDVAAVVNPVSSGDYEGPQDTTYNIEVISGGFFNPVAVAFAGLSSVTVNTVVPDVSSWAAGNVDDEYVLTCTVAGTSATAAFSLTSNRGDVASNIMFPGYGIGNTMAVGGSGLYLYLSSNAIISVGDYFVIVVKAAKPMIRITDSAGIDQESIVEVNDASAIELGLYGAMATFPVNTNKGGLGAQALNYGGLFLGERYSVVCTASEEAEIHTLVLSDDLPPELVPGLDADGNANESPDVLAIDLQLVESSVEIPSENRFLGTGYNWEAGADDVTVADDIRLQSARWVAPGGTMPYLPVTAADLYIEYRALLTEYSGSVWSISDIADVETMLGTNDPDNPLAFGVNIALQNSGSKTVYFMGVPANTSAGWRTVLDRISLNSEVYALAPITTDEAILSLVEAHINEMSGELAKKWRIGYFGTEMPSQSTVLAKSNNPGGHDWLATITDDTRVSGDQFTKVTLTESGSLVSRLHVGDTVKIRFGLDNWGNVTFTEDTVAEIVSNTVFYLENGTTSAVPVAEKIEAYHPLSTAEIATAVAAKSAGFANRRVYHVFPGNLGAFGFYVDASFGACAIAGLCSSVVPQQGLTNIEINGFDDVPVSYGMFSMAQLNEIAAGGTFILMQDVQGSAVYVRHQLSTATADGNLNTSENSVTKNLDSISYYFSSVLAPFIGRYNVTPELVDVLRAHVRNGINYLGSYTSVGLLGPQLLVEGTSIRTLQQHPTLKDRIYCVVDLQLPYPLNVIELHLVV